MVIADAETIIQRIKNRDEAAFEELYQMSYCIVRNRVLSFGIYATEFDDVIQDVFIQVYYSLDSLKDAKCYISWLMQVTNSKCYLNIKKRKRRDECAFDEELNVEECKEDYLPDKITDQIEKNYWIAKMLNTLDEKSKQILILRYMKELSMSEIAKSCHISQGTAKSRLYHARRKVALHRKLLIGRENAEYTL